ncbi:MAG: DNA mismatch repair protein MutS [Lachnospiraceae bacterium]|nr:DNA mismatch repair protein MutS [Lachnospiraceae bacterium]
MLLDEIDYDKLSPMMKLYVETKRQVADCILFYRLGDFYEMFFDDAVMVSQELGLTLTGKECGLPERAPMCGVPHHAVESYLNKLVQNGHKVAICEQVEDPKKAVGLVKREVVRIVTPGTNLDTDDLDASRNNYLMCVFCLGEKSGIATVDITTGTFLVTETDSRRKLRDEILRFSPAEIICNDAFELTGLNLQEIKDQTGATIFTLDSTYFDDEECRQSIKDHFHVGNLQGLGLADMDAGVAATGATLRYLTETQKTKLENLTTIEPYSIGKYMVLDSFTRRNLELTETLREKNRRGSLLWVLDKTKTAMGARLLRSFLEQPLVDSEEIEARLTAVEELNQNAITREELREYLGPVYDLERLISRIAFMTANPRDLIALKTSLGMVPAIKTALQEFQSPLLSSIREEIDPLEDVCSLIGKAIVDDPPVAVREGGFIREGYSEEVDHLRLAKTDGKQWLADIEAREKERTGIQKMKIRYNKVFGYYLEIPNSYRGEIPQDYIRKQTLVNAERYITPELKKLEETILGAQDRLVQLEYDLFVELRNKISDCTLRIQQTAKALAQTDVFCSLAAVAERNRYVRPKINTRGAIDIREGRHPVVEQMMSSGEFIPNDTVLDNHKNRVSIITGPNMAGKSTYMRQSALIVLMAQIGSFVPARSADIGIVDRIFTRVGASDDLASGQSTFMVEMSEVANILRQATKNSLLILDEIGRGTSTYDGLSIAWAVVEHVADTKKLGAKTLFATHYHELTELEGKIPGINNYCIAVREKGDDIVFLRKIVRGGADKSYGIQVAKLAGVPDDVISRAKELAAELSDSDITEKVQEITETDEAERPKKKHHKVDEVDMNQMSLFDTVSDADIVRELMEIDVSHLTPLDALNTIYALQNKMKNRWSGA